MEQEIEKLLTILNSNNINILPCFLDQPQNNSDINFRIGLSEGPQITFRMETQEVYNLSIRDKNQKMYQYPILFSSEQFFICQSIRDKIFTLNSSENYQQQINNNLVYFINNLENLVQPILARLLNEEN